MAATKASFLGVPVGATAGSTAAATWAKRLLEGSGATATAGAVSGNGSGSLLSPAGQGGILATQARTGAAGRPESLLFGDARSPLQDNWRPLGPTTGSITPNPLDRGNSNPIGTNPMGPVVPALPERPGNPTVPIWRPPGASPIQPVIPPSPTPPPDSVWRAPRIGTGGGGTDNTNDGTGAGSGSDSGRPYIVDNNGNLVPDPNFILDETTGTWIRKEPDPWNPVVPDFARDPAADIAERATMASLLGLQRNTEAGLARQAAQMGLRPGDPAYQALQQRGQEPLVSSSSGVLASLARDRMTGASTREQDYLDNLFRMYQMGETLSAEQLGLLRNRYGDVLGVDFGGVAPDPNIYVQQLQGYYQEGLAMGLSSQEAYARARKLLEENSPNNLPGPEATATTTANTPVFTSIPNGYTRLSPGQIRLSSGRVIRG